jgi:N-acetylmuramoyl-L-alanine amidase
MGRKHSVRQGECMARVADRFGLRDPGSIFDHPENAELKRKRKNPNVLLPGDIVDIPELEPKTVYRGTGALHRFVVRTARRHVRIALRDHGGNPVEGADYELEIGGVVLVGRTDGDGVIDADVAVNATVGTVKLPGRGVTWEVHVGHLDPIQEDDGVATIVTGLQARLNNLGYAAGPEDGELGPRTRRALARYQRVVLGRADADGEPDAETRDRLLADHGC